MGTEFELNHRQTTILVGVFFVLLFLVFIAGWLSGTLFGLPNVAEAPAPAALPEVPPREQPRPVPVRVSLPEPAPEPESEPTPEPAPVPRFSVQVGSFQTAVRAREQALALREKGYAPYILRGLNSKGVAWFTVRIGDHAAYGDAVASALGFEAAEGVVPVVTYIDTLSVVRTADGSLPEAPILNTGERIDMEALPDEPEQRAETGVEDGDAWEDDSAEGEEGEADTSDRAEAEPDEEEADAAEEPASDKPIEADAAAESSQTGEDSQDAIAETETGAAVSGPDEAPEEETADTETLSKEADGDEPVAEAAEASVTAEENVEPPEALEKDAEAAVAEDDEHGADAEPVSGDDGESPENPVLSNGGTGRFSVQVGAFLKPGNAQGLAEKLREKGYGAYVFDVDDAAGKTWHAVRLDNYDHLKDALAAARTAREAEDLPALVTRIDSLTVVAVPEGGMAPTVEPVAAVPAHPVYTVTGDDDRHPYSLRLASFRSREATENALAVYRRRGLPAFSIFVENDGGGYRLIHMGLYGSYSDAESAKEAFHLPGAVIKQTPWANLAGVHDEKADAEAQAERLAGEGFSPYLVELSDGPVQVLVGAFSTRERAEAHGESLTEKGFHSAVVER